MFPASAMTSLVSKRRKYDSVMTDKRDNPIWHIHGHGRGKEGYLPAANHLWLRNFSFALISLSGSSVALFVRDANRAATLAAW